MGSGSANQVALDPIKLQKNEFIKPTEHCAAQKFGRYLGKKPRFLFSIFFACARGGAHQRGGTLKVTPVHFNDQWPTVCPVQTFYILLRGSWEQKGFLKFPQPSKLSPRDKGAGTQVEKRKLK